MCANVHLTFGVLSVLLMSPCQGQGQCPTGWFGPKCKLKCHCNSSKTCNITDGSCPAGDSCEWQHMGPSCQYLDLSCAMRLKTPRFIYDCDDTTCNPDRNATSVELQPRVFGNPFWPSFMRIVVNDPSKLHKFNISMNSPFTTACTGLRLYPVSDTVVDVQCDNLITYSNLIITGEAVGAFCSVHVIAGRNVALKQKTWQTSNSTTHPEWGLSSNAVDGNTRNIFDNRSSCSQTAVQPLATWVIEFDWPVAICNMRVYNRDVFMNNLESFAVTTTYTGLFYRGTSRTTAIRDSFPVYELAFSHDTPTSTLNVTLSRYVTGELTLCEVEVYGEVLCEDGMWGIYCDKRCQCSLSQTCNIATGGCSTPCPTGKFGFRCELTCSGYCGGPCTERWGRCRCKPGVTAQICLSDCGTGTYGLSCEFNCSKYCTDVCNSATGLCNCMYNRTGVGCAECPDGTYGEECQLKCSKFCDGKCNSENGSCRCMYNRTGLGCQECPVGKFGEACNLTCSSGCANNVCDSTTGKCTSCTRNYSGEFCTDCLPGTYGEECTFPCPLYCADKKCDKTTGICFSCAGHRTGDSCADCVKTYYSRLCDMRCSAFCLNSLCNATTGTCFACVEGYHGAYCNKEIEETLKPLYAVLVLAPALMLFCVCCFCCGCCICCFAKLPEEPEEEEEDDKDTAISTVISGD